jgi:hypothetical protein
MFPDGHQAPAIEDLFVPGRGRDVHLACQLGCHSASVETTRPTNRSEFGAGRAAGVISPRKSATWEPALLRTARPSTTHKHRCFLHQPLAREIPTRDGMKNEADYQWQMGEDTNNGKRKHKTGYGNLARRLNPNQHCRRGRRSVLVEAISRQRGKAQASGAGGWTAVQGHQSSLELPTFASSRIVIVTLAIAA